MRDPDLADGIARLAEDGAAPFYSGDIGTAVSAWVIERGGTLTPEDLAAYAPIPRAPVGVRYHGREVLTNPPPSAGGLLIAYALALLERGDGRPDAAALVTAMEAAQAERTPDFLEHLHEPGFLQQFMGSRLGSTTHVSVLDADGWACAVTTTNGEGSGIVVPGTGISLQNRGSGFTLRPGHANTVGPGKRPAHTIIPGFVLGRDGGALMALGVMGGPMQPQGHLQLLLRTLVYGQDPQVAIDAPRWRVISGRKVAVEPGFDPRLIEGLRARGHVIVDPPDGVFAFGGAQMVMRTGAGYIGGSDPRKDGQAVGF
jgi:gamma-glutamyltranspeptidase/glutathione hydrolase